MQLHGTLVRGGTSKCWIFDAAQIDGLPISRDHALLVAFGAEDPRQLDGVGGATSTTSKAAIVGPSARVGCDIDYTFAQVGIGVPSVEWGSNCGNCATAVGLYAVQAGLVTATDAVTLVRIHNTNTGTVTETTVATPGGVVPEAGGAYVPGVVQGGVPVGLSFLDPAGGTTGKLLPTGSTLDLLSSDDAVDGAVRATLVDAGAPAALIAAEDLGLQGTESPDELLRAVGTLTGLRRAAALAMGLVRDGEPVRHAVPKIGIVGRAAAYRTTGGGTLAAEDYDVSVRMLSMHTPHPAIGLTSAVAVACAAAVPGTIPVVLGRHLVQPGSLRIGTAAGVVTARVDDLGHGMPGRVTLTRAARWIATADLLLPSTAERIASAPASASPAARTA